MFFLKIWERTQHPVQIIVEGDSPPTPYPMVAHQTSCFWHSPVSQNPK